MLCAFFDYPEVSYPGQIDEADYGKNFAFWRKAAPDQLQWFSAPAYYFAREIREKLQVPVGIVGCNWGGTPSWAWMDEQAIREGGGEIVLREYAEAVKNLDLKAYDEKFRNTPGTWASWRLDPFGDPISVGMMEGRSLDDLMREVFGPDFDPSTINPADYMPVMGPKSETRPCGLYESMLSQVSPYGLRGVLYYQGESDGDMHPELYETMFPALIRCFRRSWGEDLPFLFVQLAPFGHWLACDGTPYRFVRRAQQHTADTVENTGMAVISDIGMKLDIHPKKKGPVGQRLALLARKLVYGEELLCEAPTLCELRDGEGEWRLRFKNAGNGLNLAAKTPDGAETDPERLGGLRLFLENRELDMTGIRAYAEGDTVCLQGETLKSGRARAELGWDAWYRVNLYNSAGLPARPAKIEN